MLWISFIFSVVCFICIGLAAHAPWFILVTGTTGSMNVGMLLADYENGQDFQLVTPDKYCLGTFPTVCADYVTTSFAIYIVYAAAIIFQFLAVLAAVAHWHWGIFMLGLSLTLQCAGQFGFFFRVLGLQLSMAASIKGGSVTQWQFGWSSVLAGVSIILTFLNVIAFCLTYGPKPPPTTVAEPETKEQQQQNNNNEPTNQASQPPPAAATTEQQQQNNQQPQYYNGNPPPPPPPPPIQQQQQQQQTNPPQR
jgi:hypothetical protein